MPKRILLTVLCVLMAVLIGCAKPQSAPIESTDVPLETPEVDIAEQEPAADGGMDVLGFIINDDGQLTTYMAMHGFLRTAENLGYPARIFRTENGEAAKSAVDEAISEGCRAVMIFDPDGVNDSAVEYAVSKGLMVVVPYDKCSVSGISSNVIADTEDYIEELARGLSVRMTERKLKSGRILLYGRNTAVCAQQFISAIKTYYPQYDVVTFDRTAADDEGAIAELAQFILYNRDIKGMYVTDADLASTAVKARTQAQQLFRKDGAPSPTPPQDGESIAPTPNPGLLTAISITAFACGLSDENYALFNDNDIYALCIEPYYEACAQATMTMDKLLSGDQTALNSKVNRPIAYADSIEKYTAIFQQVKEMFGLNDGNEGTN